MRILETIYKDDVGEDWAQTKINKGDTVRITTPDAWVEGIVISASNYGSDEEPNWYIELNGCAGSNEFVSSGYTYWKQKQDGGTVELIK